VSILAANAGRLKPARFGLEALGRPEGAAGAGAGFEHPLLAGHLENAGPAPVVGALSEDGRRSGVHSAGNSSVLEGAPQPGVPSGPA